MKMEIARIILEQLGGNQFRAMTGAKNFSYDKENKALKFSFPMCRKANMCMITLNGLDLYDVKFIKINRKTFVWKTIETFNDVYNDMLQSIFSSFTGLATKLF